MSKEKNVTTSAYGLSTAYSIGASTKFALGIEHETDNIKVRNDQTLSSYETDETRPWWNGQAALVGSFGRTFQFGMSGKGRLSDSETDWRFSRAFLAGGNALGGRGHLDTRKEKASEFSVRLDKFALVGLEVAAQPLQRVGVGEQIQSHDDRLPKVPGQDPVDVGKQILERAHRAEN